MYLAKKLQSTILIDLIFSEKSNWTGGKGRSLQILDLFKKNGYEITELDVLHHPHKIIIFFWAIKGVIKFGFFKPVCLTSLRTTGHNYYKYSYYVNKFPLVENYLIEGTGFGSLQLVDFLKSYKKKVYLIPQNIESMGPYPEAWTHKGIPMSKRFEIELKYYKKADAIFCISMEESWLLSVYGCKAFFLPYNPPDILKVKIKDRYNQRLNSIKEGYFYFGDFRNNPNYFGLQEFLKNKLYIGKKIRIAGLGFDRVREMVTNYSEFILLGELSSEELEKELITAEYVILNHFPTTGMLTRIPELLFSGIPVEGNEAALKAYRLIANSKISNETKIEILLNEEQRAANIMFSLIQ